MNALGHYVETVWCKCGHVTETKAYEEAGATDVLEAHHETTYDVWCNETRSEGNREAVAAAGGRPR